MSACCEVVSHPLFSTILHEHTCIRNSILEALTTEHRKRLLDWLWEEVEEGNHFREEAKLFRAVLGHPNLQEGGPFCSLYFDEHLSRPPREIARKMTGQDLVWLDRQAMFKDTRTSLDIPLEEHRAAHVMLGYLRARRDFLSEDQFNKDFETYKSLLFRHMEKEERCFFRMCGTLLTEQQLDSVLAAWMERS